jgi:predicted transport protein
MEYVKLEKISLKGNSEFNERWVQQRIADDPSILGLGDLVLKDKERLQPKAGRLDLLFQDSDANLRYETEIQLGRTNENHIIRTIEYWDLERKRYPQYDHVAVIVAEDITSRFLNVISLFNGFIPIVAIQMSALKLKNQISLVFTKVVDQMTLGLEEEEDVEIVDRSYWEKRGTKKTVEMADKLLAKIKTFVSNVELKYNKFYIGLAQDGQPNNFIVFKPQKNAIRVEMRMQRSDEIENKISEKGLDLMDYDSKWGRYRIRLSKPELKDNIEFLTELMKRTYEETK